MSTPIADMVREMLAKGVDPDVIALAVATAEKVTVPRNSAEFHRDISAERRRERDRDRKRNNKTTPQNSAESAEIPQNSTSPLTLSSSQGNSEEVKEGKKVRARKPPAAPLSAEFQPKQGHFDAAEKLGIPRQAVFEKCEDMRLWAQGNGILKVDWDATLHGFLRRDASKLSTNGNGNGPHQPKPGSIPDIARRYAEHFESQARDGIEGHSGAILRLSQR